MFLIMACDGDECLRYELGIEEAAPMAALLRRLGWAVTVLKELGT